MVIQPSSPWTELRTRVFYKNSTPREPEGQKVREPLFVPGGNESGLGQEKTQNQRPGTKRTVAKRLTTRIR